MTAYFLTTGGSVLLMDTPPGGTDQRTIFDEQLASGALRPLADDLVEQVDTVDPFDGSTITSYRLIQR